MTGGEQGQGHDLGGLDWRDGVIPVSRRFDDPYFSLNDGLAETGHVFLAGNNLPARLTPGFQVAELGFGTGLNLLALHLCNPGHPIRFTSFEAWFFGSCDFQCLTGLWVTTDASWTISHGESTETNQNNGVASLQSASDGFDYSVQRTASSSFRDISGCSDSINQFRLVHSKSPYIYLR